LPVQLLFGDNTLELDEAVHAVRRTFPSTDAIAFDGGSAPLSDLTEACLTVGLFDPERLVIVRNLHERIKGSRKESGEMEEIKRLLGSVPSTTTVMLVSPGMAADHPLVSAVRGIGGPVKTFNTPKRGELARWIVERAGAHHATIEREAADLLVELVGSNAILLDTELEKLATYAGEGTRITAAMVDELVGAVTQESIFTLVDAIAAGNRGKALQLLHAQLAQASSTPTDFALYLIRMLARQARILLRIHLGQEKGRRTQQIMADLNIRSYHADRYMRQAKRLSKSRLCDAFERLASLEQGLKSGTADAATGLDILVTELCS
jgi:DNA polymerase-3 subunit delta